MGETSPEKPKNTPDKARGSISSDGAAAPLKSAPSQATPLKNGDACDAGARDTRQDIRWRIVGSLTTTTLEKARAEAERIHSLTGATVKIRKVINGVPQFDGAVFVPSAPEEEK